MEIDDIALLVVRNIKREGAVFANREVLAVPGDTHDGDRTVPADHMAHGIGVSKQPPAEIFVDDGHSRSAVPVGRQEFAATQQADAHGLEIIRRDPVEVEVHSYRMVVQIGGEFRAHGDVIVERDCSRNAGRLDTRERTQLIESAGDESSRFLRRGIFLRD